MSHDDLKVRVAEKSRHSPKACRCGVAYLAIPAILVCSLLISVSTIISQMQQFERETGNEVILSEAIEETSILTNQTVMKKIMETNEVSAVTTSNNVTSEEEGKRFSYAFLVAGCQPNRPTYRGYLYNIAVAKYLLSYYNSTADVVAMIRMHPKSDHTTLPPEHEAILTKSGVKVKYLPKPVFDNFHTAMMDKFRLLELVEYDRVLYLDADVMPINNLDFMFEKSVGHDKQLENNTILAFNNEPANGGFFMLTPNKDDYIEIKKIIMKREAEGYDFDAEKGFGHVITPPDKWISLFESGRKWDFYASFSDQGLLYHWTKYVKKCVTILLGERVVTYKADENGNILVVRNETSKNVFNNVHFPKTKLRIRNANKMNHVVPYNTFVHFVEATKPWFDRHAKNPPKDIDSIEDATSTKQLWYHVLRKVNEKYNLNIDAENLSIGRPLLGLFPTNQQVMLANNARSQLGTS